MRMARNFASIGALAGLFLLAGCGDPVPPAAQAGISIHIQAYDDKDPVHGKDNCTPGQHWVNVPYDRARTPSQQTQQTDMTDSRMTAVNNQDGNSVACSVTANGNGFKVSADAVGYASSDTEKRKPSTVHIRIPKIAPGESDAAGQLTLQDDASINAYQSSECTYSVSGDSLGVAAGSIWAKVICENLAYPPSPGSVCLVDTGYFLLENCGQ
jgi:hypothetical protein